MLKVSYISSSNYNNDVYDTEDLTDYDVQQNTYYKNIQQLDAIDNYLILFEYNKKKFYILMNNQDDIKFLQIQEFFITNEIPLTISNIAMFIKQLILVDTKIRYLLNESEVKHYYNKVDNTYIFDENLFLKIKNSMLSVLYNNDNKENIVSLNNAVLNMNKDKINQDNNEIQKNNNNICLKNKINQENNSCLKDSYNQNQDCYNNNNKCFDSNLTKFIEDKQDFNVKYSQERFVSSYKNQIQQEEKQENLVSNYKNQLQREQEQKELQEDIKQDKKQNNYKNQLNQKRREDDVNQEKLQEDIKEIL